MNKSYSDFRKSDSPPLFFLNGWHMISKPIWKVKKLLFWCCCWFLYIIIQSLFFYHIVTLFILMTCLYIYYVFICWYIMVQDQSQKRIIALHPLFLWKIFMNRKFRYMFYVIFAQYNYGDFFLDYVIFFCFHW